jgi:hypothetical protein
MGLAFAEHLTQYAESKNIKLGHITKIEQNPDQSKHLETATLKVFGQDIDLVNLRSEEYVADSRIPKEVVCQFFVFPIDCLINYFHRNTEHRWRILPGVTSL